LLARFSNAMARFCTSTALWVAFTLPAAANTDCLKYCNVYSDIDSLDDEGMLKTRLQALTEDSAPDFFSDSLAISDASANTGKKNKISTLEAWVTPEDFGAVGDGFSDDTEAVQAAVNTGKNVLLPNQYWITSPISITSGNRSLRGAGKGKITLKSDQNIPYLVVDASSGNVNALSVSDLGFMSANFGIKTSEAAVKLTTPSIFTASWNSFYNIAVMGLYHGFLFVNAGTGAASWNNISGLTTVPPTEYGVRWMGGGTGLVIANSNLTIGGGGRGACIRVGGASKGVGDLTILGVQCGGTGTGIHLVGDGSYGARISITGAQFDAGIKNGLILDNVHKLQGNGILWGGATSYTITSNSTDIDIDFYQVVTPPRITADQNNYSPTGLQFARALELTSDAARSITGLAEGYDGRVIILRNANASKYITLVNESASSTAADRFSLPANFAIEPKTSVVLRYIGGSTNRWVQDAAGGNFRW
jgi:hypothetical protein